MSKVNTVTIRLSENEKRLLKINADAANMQTSQYIRSLITNTEIKTIDHHKDIASMLCKIYILLAEENIDTHSPVMEELNKLCQTLS